MPVSLKAGVVLTLRQPALERILEELKRLSRVFDREIVISCGNEGHSPTDPHTTGEACDLSVAGMSPQDIVNIRSAIQGSLGEKFYIQYETPTLPTDPDVIAIAVVSPKASAPHFHVQRRKGTVYTLEDYLQS